VKEFQESHRGSPEKVRHFEPAPINSGILLVAHGTRDADGIAECRTLAAKVAQAVVPCPVEVGYIELAEPTIGQAFDRLVERGARQVRVVPLLLFAAGHAKNDVPAAVRQASARHPLIAYDIAPPFDLDEDLLALSQRRYAEALVNRPPVDDQETFLLLVGRGSSDAQACDRLAQFARQRGSQRELAGYGWCCVTAARPTLEEGLSQAAASNAKRIVVQPHLLFRGFVLGQIHSAVARRAAAQTQTEWILAPHLGPEPEVADAILAHFTANHE
jgi:sirohydrochlorin ferrochelatase